MKAIILTAGLVFLSTITAQANDGCPSRLSARMFRDYDVTWTAEKEITITRQSPPFFYSNQNKWRDYWATSITVSFETDFPQNKIPAGTRFEEKMEPFFIDSDGTFRPSMAFYLQEITKQDPSDDSYYRKRTASVRVLHLKEVRVKRLEAITGLTLTCRPRQN